MPVNISNGGRQRRGSGIRVGESCVPFIGERGKGGGSGKAGRGRTRGDRRAAARTPWPRRRGRLRGYGPVLVLGKHRRPGGLQPLPRWEQGRG
jgi:hypothetical protein